MCGNIILVVYGEWGVFLTITDHQSSMKVRVRLSHAWLYDVLMVLTSLSKFAYFSKYHKVRQILDWTWFFLTYRNFSFHPTFYEATLPPCQVINCYVHMYAPSSEYFKRVKQRARVLFLLRVKLSSIIYLLANLFVCLAKPFVRWGKGP